MSGFYICSKNKISILKKYKKSALFHELLHLASNNININNESTGLKYMLKKVCIGSSINEGYTELLLERYFNDIYDEDDLDIYEFERIMSGSLETIAAKEKMETCYFTSDL